MKHRYRCVDGDINSKDLYALYSPIHSYYRALSDLSRESGPSTTYATTVPAPHTSQNDASMYLVLSSLIVDHFKQLEATWYACR